MRPVVLFALVLSVACTDPGDPAAREYAAHPAVGEEFTLRVGERVLIEAANIDLRFLEVVDDSRCPDNALIQCVWIGDAGVVVEMTPEFADAVHDTLHTTLDPDVIDLGPVTLALLKLDPYPHDVTPIPQDEYVATMIVQMPQ